MWRHEHWGGVVGETHHYRVFGLPLSSALPLPELPPVADGSGSGRDVSIRVSIVPPALPDVGTQEPCFRTSNGEVILAIHNVARYRVSGGNDIIVDPHPQGSARDVRLYLLGSAFGVLCHQRGLLPLHANAIVADGRAIAFAGAAGAGKSTLAAQFLARGHDVLGDDVCAVGFDAAGQPWAWPGLPQLKLWRDAAAWFGHDCDALERVVDGQDKYHVPLTRDAACGPFPLARVCVLDGDPASQRGIARLTGADALDALLRHTYRIEYVKPMGLTQRHFAQCLALLDHAEIHAAPLRRGFDVLDDEAARLERHFVGWVSLTAS